MEISFACSAKTTLARAWPQLLDECKKVVDKPVGCGIVQLRYINNELHFLIVNKMQRRQGDGRCLFQGEVAAKGH